MVLKKRSTFWGVKPAQYKQWLDLPPHVIAAKQWRASVEVSIRDGRALPDENYAEFRYENLMKDPEQVISEMIEFAQLDTCPAMIDYAAGHIDPSRASKAEANLTDQQMKEAMEEMAPLLKDLGYEV